MKKMLVVSSVFLTSLVAGSASASYLPAVQSMVALGIADRSTVLNNVYVYNAILTSIEKNIRNPNFVQKQINDLSSRFNQQMSFVGYDFSSVIAPELESAIEQAKIANAKNDVQALKQIVVEAKKQLKEISVNI